MCITHAILRLTLRALILSVVNSSWRTTTVMDDEHIDAESEREFVSNLYKRSEDNYFQSTPRKTLRTCICGCLICFGKS